MKRIVSGILLMLLLAMSSLSFNIKIVKSELGTIIVPDDYPTIQQAIDACEPGGTILVAPGTYYESISMNKPISLIGEDRKSTIIIGSGIGDVVYISSDEVMISGFTIKGSGTKYIGPFSGGDAGIELDHVANCSVFNLIVTGNTLGISLVFSKNNLIANNLVISNNAEGIFLVSSNNNLIINNTCNSNGMHGGIWLALSSSNAIINNTANFNLDIGIKLHTSSNNIVENNVCLNNKHVGIFLRSSSNNTLTHNTCNSNDQPGIYLESSCNNTLKNNICKFITDWGIVLRTLSNHNIVINNTSSNNDYGIDLKSSTGNTLVNNVFSSNNIGITFENSSNNEVFYNIISMNIIGVGIGVIEVEGAKFGNLAGNKINMNDIYGNAQFGILNESPTEVNATLNWWGDRSGPHHSISNPNGKGDRVSDNVLFKPCLTAPIEKVMGPTLKLSNLSISPTKAKINEAISISINLTNIGDLPATFTISLKVNGSIEAVRDIMLSGRECAVVTFKISKNVAGTYNVEVNGLNGTFNILKLSSSLSLSVSRKDLKKGEQVTVSGFINPPLAGIAVTLTFERPDGTNFTENVLTDINGSFTYAVTPEDVGKWSVHASWLGDENYEGTFSPSLSFTVMEKDALTPTPSPTPYPTPVPSPTYEAIPKWLIGVAIAIVIMIGIGVWAILKRKRK